MKSPVGDRLELLEVELEKGLKAWRCPESGGHWIPAENYWRWNKGHEPQPLTELEAGVGDVQPRDEHDEELKLCPETGTIMTRYRVGYGLGFRIDRSITGGIWLDSGEWESLVAADFHHELHRIFTTPWQNELRSRERDQFLRERLQDRLGGDLYQRLVSLSDELDEHPAGDEAVAFLRRGSMT